MSTVRGMDEDVVRIPNKILLSHLKKNKIAPFAAMWRDPEIIILSKVRQKKTNIAWYHSHVESHFFKRHK